MIDEIDYFPKRERHNKKKVDSSWSVLKKQKNKKNENSREFAPEPKKKSQKNKGE
tara:strand:+ start:68 stop:232 length:165 start_codon:yes stop_codon:yes gene_type:complete